MLPRVAIDANVLISGIGWPRWCYEVLRYARQGDFFLVLSPLIIEEAQRRISHHLPDHQEMLDDFLFIVRYEKTSIPSKKEVATNKDLMRQEKDIPIALSIAAAQPDYFVTYDRDFTDKNKTTENIRKIIPGIILPPLLLKDVMGWTSEQLETVRHRQWSDLDQ